MISIDYVTDGTFYSLLCHVGDALYQNQMHLRASPPGADGKQAIIKDDAEERWEYRNVYDCIISVVSDRAPSTLSRGPSSWGRACLDKTQADLFI